jgi:hypothetical protein
MDRLGTVPSGIVNARDTGVVYGITLTWKFEPVARGTCLRRWERYHDEKSRRRKRVAELFGSWLASHARRGAATNLKDAIRARMEAEKREHLARVAGGLILKGESK